MTVGIPWPDATRARYSSSPVMPGIRMSATTQAALARLSDPRKLSALQTAEKPAALNKSRVALRIDSSSSTMATSGPLAISPPG